MNFIDALKASDSPLDDCIRYLMVWIAAVDGDVHDDELEWLEENLDERQEAIPVQTLIRAIAERNVAYEVVALTAVKQALDSEKRALVLELGIGIAMADGRMMHSELHALRFIADGLSISPARFDEIYFEETNTRTPELADLSDPGFWEEAERRAKERSASDGAGSGGNRGQQSSNASSAKDQKTREALAVLGLVEGASQSEIRDAYRRLASVHHPDRFTSLGDSATAAATKTFQRIKGAYDHLSHAESRA